ncbi:PAS domain S-box protein [Allomuricauda sp. M10]|uniref:PAS domain-containing sensor histidine kinase n=1 Tax=Allomuricauda sp. M10 TaxID=2683292 RepID=UPI001D182867|nr:PAS domain S-box protein [Muricauda sp. M10]
MEHKEIQILKRALERERKARKQAESILESKSKELYDTSEHLKRANAKLEGLLEERSDDMDAAFFNIIDPYVVMDLEFNVLRANRSAKEFLALDHSKGNVNLSNFVHPDFAQYTAESMQALLDVGSLKNYRAKIVLSDGAEKYVQINASLIYDRKGSPMAAQGVIRDITQEKEIEELLSKHRKQLDIIVENSPLGIVLKAQGQIVKSNVAIQEMLGYSHEELKKISTEDITLEEELAETKRLMGEMETGRLDHYTINKTYVRKDGSQFMAKAAVTSVRDTNSPIHYEVFIVEDVTKSMKAEAQLKESENRLATLVKNLEMAVLLEDEDRKMALTNKKFCEMFGIQAPPEALIGIDCANAAEDTKTYFKEPEQFVTGIEKILKERKMVLSDELEMVDGRILERDYIPIMIDGTYKGHLWSYRDITLRKTYKRNLQIEKEKYSGIIANMNLGLIEIDNEDRIQLVNESFCQMSGFGRKELIGKNSKNILSMTNKAVIDEDSLKKIKQHGDSLEVEVLTKQGETRYWLVSAAPRFDQAQRKIGLIGINLDITEHKKLQLEKENLMAKLEASNQSLKEYAYVVSHDLKSPLRSIEALASWLKNDYSGTLDRAGKEYLDMIQDKIESMENLISGILAYSTANTSELNNTEVDLHEVVLEIVESIYIPEHVKVITSQKLPIVVADRTKMRQLFQNIISNAVVHIEKPKGKVELRFEEKTDFWEFCIKDNGIGIPKKYHEKIFEIFQSAGGSKKSTGIGLSIVKKIVDRYHGEVWIESEEGIGTEFYFTLEKNTIKKSENEDTTGQKNRKIGI